MEQLQTEHGIFTNNEATGQTAQECYNEWLANKDKPQQPTEIEKLQQEVIDLKAVIDTMLTGGTI